MNKDLLIALILITVAQAVTYFQLQSQFFWTWAKEHPVLLSLGGFPISIILMYFTKYCAAAFDGATWPGRLIGFSIGAIVFALLSYFVMKEDMTMKTGVCLMLAACILSIQIYWK
jgi:hypothetical protein